MRLVLVLVMALSGTVSAAERTFHFSVLDGTSCRVKDLTITRVNLRSNDQVVDSTAARNSPRSGLSWTNNAGLVKFEITRDDVTHLEISFNSQAVSGGTKLFQVSDGYGEAAAVTLYSNYSNRPGAIANCCGNAVTFQTLSSQPYSGTRSCDPIPAPCCSPCCPPIEYRQFKPSCPSCEASEPALIAKPASDEALTPQAATRKWARYAMIGAIHLQASTRKHAITTSTSKSTEHPLRRM